MNDLIQRLMNSIIRQEGMGQDNPNPGNLRDCPWFPVKMLAYGPGAKPQRHYPKIPNTQDEPEDVKYANGFWIPRSRSEGVAGAAHVIALHVAQGDSLRQLISRWAPPSENDTESYIRNVAGWAGISNAELPLWDYILESVT